LFVSLCLNNDEVKLTFQKLTYAQLDVVQILYLMTVWTFGVLVALSQMFIKTRFRASPQASYSISACVALPR